MTTQTDDAKQQAKVQLDSITEMVLAVNLDWDRLEELRELRDDECRAEGLANHQEWSAFNEEAAEELAELAEEAGEYDGQEEVEQGILEDPLSVLVRSGWAEANTEMEAEEYEILLCTGGPAVRIRGTLDQHKQPESARLEYQDWGTGWIEYHCGQEDESIMIEYSGHFFFGE